MRVLHCIDALGIGGKERQAVELIRGLASDPEIDLRVVCLDADDFYLRDLRAARMSVDIIPRGWRWDPGVFRKLYRLVDLHRPDVIHTNGLVSSFYMLPLARRWRVPVINGSIRNAFTGGDFRWTVERILLKASDYRVANSRAGLQSRGFSEQDPKNVVIYNGFDFARVERPSVRGARQCVAFPARTTIVGMVAEFNRYKDYFTFIEAARIVSRSQPNTLFLTVGNGQTLEACRAAAADLANVRFLGKQKDVEEVIETFDIGVLSTFVEGLSNSIMEYMAFGKPVVATDGGGTRELVADGETGLLVRPSDPSALAAAIEHLIEHPDTAQRMGRAGRIRLNSEFQIGRMITETTALYRRAIAERYSVGGVHREYSGTNV